LVDVNELVREAQPSASERFECFGCGQRLVAHLKDDLRARHFAHYTAGDCVGYETYLHRAAKTAFLETYLNCLAHQKPFTLRVPILDTCIAFRSELGFSCSRPSLQELDLTRWLDSASEETQFQTFKPDVLLRSSKSGRPMFVEVAVTHLCEEEKIASGTRILELSVTSDTDIALIRSGRITVEDNGLARVYNFKLKPEEGSFCNGDCPRHVGVFVVHRSGRPNLFSVPAAKALAFKPPSAAWQRVLTRFEEAPPFVKFEQREYLGNDLPPGNSLMQRASMAAALDGVTVRTCEVCRNQGTGSLLGVWCHVHRENVHPSQAAKCCSFQMVHSLAELKRIYRRNEEWLKKRR